MKSKTEELDEKSKILFYTERIGQKMQHEEFILTSKNICNSNPLDYEKS